MPATVRRSVDWFAQVKARGVRSVARALGLTVYERAGHGIGPCPACNAPTRHTKSRDKRGALGLTDDAGWRCFQCGESGDGITLAALVVTGRREPDGQGWADVRRRLAAADLCDPDPRDGAPLPPRRPRLAPPPPKPAQDAPRYPPAGEVAEIWSRCVPVAQDAEVSAYLVGRKIDPAAVVDRDLARALPAGKPLPAWAKGPGGAFWSMSGHRLIVPLYSVDGRIASVRARAVRPLPEDGKKALAASGYQVGGLFMADDYARRMLTDQGGVARGFVRGAGVIVAEGDPLYLTWATHWGDEADQLKVPAVLGIVAGSWTPELAATVPDGTRVTVDVDDDDAGTKYLRQIQRTLEPRCPVFNMRKQKRGSE